MKACTQMTKAELIQSIAQLKKRQSAGVVALAHERMAQDLEVHQVELETQNQELQGAQHLLPGRHREQQQAREQHARPVMGAPELAC